MRRNKNAGFTLAEVLITMSIIGVVAALTIPQLVKNMNDYAFTKSKEVTLAKITEATNQMKSNDVLAGYTTNSAFADEFQKYMKINKRCDSSNLTSCFPAKFKTGSGKDVDTTTLTIGTKLGDNNISGNTISLMLANGTSVLFTLRDSTKVSGACDRIDPMDNQVNTTGCLSFLYDVNGSGSPNVMGKDIGSVNATVSTCDGVTAGALCVAVADATYSYVGTFYDGFSMANRPCGYCGAVQACAAMGMRLPTMAELGVMYANKAAIGGLVSDWYWSSEIDPSWAWKALNFYMGNGQQGSGFQIGINSTRCVK